MSAKPAKPAAEGEQPPPKKGPGMVLWILIAVLCGGAGFAVPIFLTPGSTAAGGPGGHGGAHSGAEHPVLTTVEKPAYISYGEVIANLNDGRMSRFLRMRLTLQVDASQEKKVNALIEENRILLKNWLLSHLSDKDMESIRGAAGQNMLRREILERFNSVLFPDGVDLIYDALFEEFNVQ